MLPKFDFFSRIEKPHLKKRVYGTHEKKETDDDYVSGPGEKMVCIPHGMIVVHAPKGNLHEINELVNIYPEGRPDIFVELKKGDPLIIYNPKLKTVTYAFGEGDVVDMEITFIAELTSVIKNKKFRILKSLEKVLRSINADPVGSKTLDPHKSKIRIHSINRAGRILEKFFGFPVAIKGVNLNIPPGGKVYQGEDDFYSEREDLEQQFNQSRGLWLKFRKVFTKEELEVMDVCKPYAYISYNVKGEKQQEDWILMQKVDGIPLETMTVTDHSYYARGKKIEVFDHNQHPELAKIATHSDMNELYWYFYRKLSGEGNGGNFDFSASIGDLHGRNFLVTTTRNWLGRKRKKYTIIDPR